MDLPYKTQKGNVVTTWGSSKLEQKQIQPVKTTYNKCLLQHYNTMRKINNTCLYNSVKCTGITSVR